MQMHTKTLPAHITKNASKKRTQFFFLTEEVPVSISCLRMYATVACFHFPVANCNYFISLSITPIPLPLSTALRFHQFTIINENG